MTSRKFSNCGARAKKKCSQIGAGDSIILGALDRSLIDEVIKRHVNQIRYVYQRTLAEHPTLAGTMTVKFTIVADGTVSSAEIKTSDWSKSKPQDIPAGKEVEKGVCARFMKIQFPQPKGGGLVITSETFNFSQAPSAAPK